MKNILCIVFIVELLPLCFSCSKSYEFELEKITTGNNNNNNNNNTNYTETAYGISMDMVWVDGGSFTMGSNRGDSDEQPVHSVTLDGYWIGATEVTQSQWESVMGTSIRQQRDKAGYSSLYGEGDNYPMYYVNYADAKEFCRLLSERTGETYMLPTEAQWEYAARGGNMSNGYTYSGSNSISNVAWYADNSASRTHAVKTKSANELGLYDMSGNVWEWCSDWYDSSYYSNSPSRNPKGPSSGDYRILRGGSWFNNESSCRVAYRGNDGPSDRGSGSGFRVVCLP